MSECICDWPETCGGLGALVCGGCGGDLCVCPCGGEANCPGFDECPDAEDSVGMDDDPYCAEEDQ